MPLYQVLFKKGPHGIRTVHRQYVDARDRKHALELCAEKARELSVFRLTPIPVADDHPQRMKVLKDAEAFCRKAGH